MTSVTPDSVTAPAMAHAKTVNADVLDELRSVRSQLEIVQKRLEDILATVGETDAEPVAVDDSVFPTSEDTWKLHKYKGVVYAIPPVDCQPHFGRPGVLMAYSINKNGNAQHALLCSAYIDREQFLGYLALCKAYNDEKKLWQFARTALTSGRL